MYRIIFIAGLILTSGLCFSEESNSQQKDRELQIFSQVLDKVRAGYVDVPSDNQLQEKSIEDLLSNLDPHSTYLDKDEYQQLQGKTSGNAGGLGIDISLKNQVVQVVTTLDNSPARQAGIQSGDQIIDINYQTIEGMDLKQVTAELRGKQGSEIILGIARPGDSERIEFTLERELAPKSSVRSQMLEQGIGYIRIAVFQTETSEEFKSAINQLQDEGPLQGLVLDLRNNPGGLMPISVEVADTLIDQGLLLYTEGRLPEANKQYYATYGDLTNGAPIAVLINGGSASASEIVAGALQDQERATIIGTQSFGKGSVQSIMPLGDGRAIKLTTAHYLTPSGRFIHGQGIEPDIIVEATKPKTGGNDNQITQAIISLKQS
ncbi:MAG: Carboxy-terminal processing protease CtpB [Cellvibrionales bacterium UBA7375]|nr:MAG: Carboxy-terminal processing protease CtpB [Cellvibrionales bacterium UBA7375]